MKENSADLFRRSEIVRFNREANDRAPTEWFSSLPAKRQASINRSLDRHWRKLHRMAIQSQKREAKASRILSL